MPGFAEEGIKEVRPITLVSGGGGKRARWTDKSGRIYEWDSQHGEVEIHNKTGKKHLGGFDPKTGERVSDPKPGRRLKK